MSKMNENKNVPSLLKTNDIENKSVKCILSYGGSEMFTQIKRTVLPGSSLKKKKTLKRKSFEPVMLVDEETEGVKHMKTLKCSSFEWVMSDDEEAEGVKYIKTLKQNSFELVMSDDHETQEVEHVKESDFWNTQITLMEMCQSSEELVHNLWNTEFPDFITEFHTVMCLSDIVDKSAKNYILMMFPRTSCLDLSLVMAAVCVEHSQ